MKISTSILKYFAGERLLQMDLKPYTPMGVSHKFVSHFQVLIIRNDYGWNKKAPKLIEAFIER